MPCHPGKSLQLHVLRNRFKFPLSQLFIAIMSKPFDVNMSPRINITIDTKLDCTIGAVLKLYEHRFVTDLRIIRGKHAPQTTANEAIFQSFIQAGKTVLSFAS